MPISLAEWIILAGKVFWLLSTSLHRNSQVYAKTQKRHPVFRSATAEASVSAWKIFPFGHSLHRLLKSQALSKCLLHLKKQQKTLLGSRAACIFRALGAETGFGNGVLKYNAGNVYQALHSPPSHQQCE